MKSFSAERVEVDAARNFSNATNQWEQERGDKEGNGTATAISVTAPPEIRQPRVPRLSRSGSLPSARNDSICPTSIGRKRSLQCSTRPPRDNLMQMWKKPGGVRSHCHVQEGGTEDGSKSMTKNFGIHAGEIALGSCLKAVATSVPEKSTCNSTRALEDGSCVPRHAASGLLKTTLRKVNEQNKLARQLPRPHPSKCEMTQQPLRCVPQCVNQEVWTPSTASIYKAAPIVNHSSIIAMVQR